MIQFILLAVASWFLIGFFLGGWDAFKPATASVEMYVARWLDKENKYDEHVFFPQCTLREKKFWTRAGAKAWAKKTLAKYLTGSSETVTALARVSAYGKENRLAPEGFTFCWLGQRDTLYKTAA